MAEFGNGHDSDGLKKLDADGGIMLPVLESTKQFDPRTKSGDSDWLSELDRKAKEAAESQVRASKGIKIPPLDVDKGIVTERESEESKLLRRARQLIIEEKYEEALEPLNELLAGEPMHQEALYLKALCHGHLGNDREALLALAPLRPVRLERQLGDRVEALKAAIRARMTPAIILIAALLVHAEQHDEAVRRVREVVELDPEPTIYHFILGGVLMTAERFDEALDSVEYGLKVTTDSDTRILEDLKKNIRNRSCASRMEPAKDLFKRGKYREARTALHKLSGECKNTTLFETFDGYLAKLGGRGLLGFGKTKEPSEVSPPGTFKEQEELYFFLVDKELRGGVKLMGEDQLDKAGEIFETSLGFCPQFPYANYLYAGCLFQRISEQIGSSNPPDIDVAISTLESARSHARTATTDSDIADSAGDLVTALDDAVTQLNRVKRELRGRAEEARLVNGLIEEFNGIMEEAGDGIKSVGRFRSAHEKMKALRSRLKGARGKVRSSEGREVLKKLSEAVDRNFRQMESAKLVEDAYHEFESIMKSAKDGIKSVSQYRSAYSRMKKLKSSLPGIRKKLESADGQEALDQLSEAVDRNFRQLESIEPSIETGEKVENHVTAFNTMMEMLNTTGISSHSQLTGAISFFEELKRNVEADRRALTDPDAREVLDKLLEAIENVLRQLHFH